MRGYDAQIEDAEIEHAPFFDALRKITGLQGHIWQSGGMTMTIQVPLPGAATHGDDAGYPAYEGLKEGEDEDGRWYGSVALYTTYDDESPVVVVEAYTEPLHPSKWAEQVAAHYEAVA